MTSGFAAAELVPAEFWELPELVVLLEQPAKATLTANVAENNNEESPVSFHSLPSLKSEETVCI